MGMTYQRGAVWWVKSYRNGARSENRAAARRNPTRFSLLKIRKATSRTACR